jgi:hypothetical protein
VFPYFAVRSFEAKAYEARIQAGFEMITYAPIVSKESSWIDFVKENYDWIDESKRTFDILEPGQNRANEPKALEPPETIWTMTENGALIKRKARGIFLPSFQISPPPINNGNIFANVDLFSDPNYKSVSLAAVKLNDSVFSRFDEYYSKYSDQTIGEAHHQSLHDTFHTDSRVSRMVHPHSIAAQPVYDSMSRNTKVIGYLFGVIAWDTFLVDLLPEGVNGIMLILRNSCDQAVTYRLNGNEVCCPILCFCFDDHADATPLCLLDDFIIQAYFVGTGQLHAASFNSQRRTINFARNYFDPEATSQVDGHCQIFLDVYPSDEFVASYTDSIPIIFTVIVAMLFLIMAVIFAVYNRYLYASASAIGDTFVMNSHNCCFLLL